MAKVKTTEEIERMIMDYILDQKTRAGEIIMLNQAWFFIQKQEIDTEEYVAAIESMYAKGYLERTKDANQPKLTESGFAAL